MGVRRFPPLIPKNPRILHGADYNPEQWTPEVWAEDFRLMDLSRTNSFSVGIFSWVSYEPAEGQYEFGWLDTIMDRLAETGRTALLATPSAAPPMWLGTRYPETMRVTPDGHRLRPGNRVVYNLHSPIYRAKCREVAEVLAKRYGAHAALGGWHVSNEYGGMDYSPETVSAFREWLKRKYGSLDALNHAYWAAFWSHTFTDWEQITPPGPLGDGSMMALNLDWRKFTSDATIDFFLNEVEPLRRITPEIPITTNFMGYYQGLDYGAFAKVVDFVSWDSYPNCKERHLRWDDWAGIGMIHDSYRAFKQGQPWVLMECSPSAMNWSPVMSLKRPGQHVFEGLQAVAHGADGVQYFQWRASRGSMEKFHGAVVAHDGTEHTRVFAEVADLGAHLEGLQAVVGTTTRAKVALVYDWPCSWAIDEAAGPRQKNKGYVDAVKSAYLPFWSRGISVDVIDQTASLDGYRLLVAPMAYALRPGFAERVAAFVEAGGTFVTTYWSGIVDENDLAFLGGYPGPWREMLGIWNEELDALFDGEQVPVRVDGLGMNGDFEAREMAALIHAQTAEVLGVYAGDGFYAGKPALTVNRFGEGLAYYVAARLEEGFQDEFFGALARNLLLAPVLDATLAPGVTAQLREADGEQFVFLMNANAFPAEVTVNEPGLSVVRASRATFGQFPGTVSLEGYGVVVFRREG